MPHTFKSLAESTDKQLETILKAGTAPPLGDVLGWEFDGWNVNDASRIIGSQKFKKGFFGTVEYGYGWGYNMTMEQNGFNDPWIPTPSPENPRRHLFWGVVPANHPKATKPKYKKSLVIDYRLWPEHLVVNPIRNTVDYCVYVNPGDKDLILGKSYLESGLVDPFLGFFLLRRPANKSGYNRTSYFLTAEQLETVKAFAEVLLPENPVIDAQEVTWNIDRHLERVQSERRNGLQLVLFVIDSILPNRTGFPIRERFSKMPPDERKRFLTDWLVNADTPILRDLAKIRTLFGLNYYSDPRVFPSIGFKPVEDRPQFDADVYQPLGSPPVRNIVVPDRNDTLKCDVCVIGSGAGGAVVAGNLAAAGKDVIVLEEGHYFDAGRMTHDESVALTNLYKEGGLQATTNFDVLIPQGRCLGGTTAINNAICIDARDDVLDEWQALGANIDRPRLRQSFTRVRDFTKVQSMPDLADPRVPAITGQNASVLLEGWKKLAAAGAAPREHMFFEKHLKQCLGCGYCNFGCKYDRRLTMLETYLPKASQHGARIILGSQARKIEKSGKKAKKVVCERWNGDKFKVEAKSIVISAGAIASSLLLMQSGIRVVRRGKDLVGQRFSFNVGTPAFALFPDRAIDAYNEAQMGAYVGSNDGKTTGGYLLESHFEPPGTFAASMPGWFGTHAERLKDFRHWASAGVLVRSEPNASVVRDEAIRNLVGPVEYDMTDKDFNTMKTGIANLAKIWFAAGAEKVLPAAYKDFELLASRFKDAPIDDIKGELDRCLTSPDQLTLSSAHPQGGNAMSDKQNIGVLDSSFRVKGLDNLFVCDASVFPSSVGVNPVMTIMAMADYFTTLDVV